MANDLFNILSIPCWELTSVSYLMLSNRFSLNLSLLYLIYYYYNQKLWHDYFVFFCFFVICVYMKGNVKIKTEEKQLNNIKFVIHKDAGYWFELVFNLFLSFCVCILLYVSFIINFNNNNQRFKHTLTLYWTVFNNLCMILLVHAWFNWIISMLIAKFVASCIHGQIISPCSFIGNFSSILLLMLYTKLNLYIHVRRLTLVNVCKKGITRKWRDEKEIHLKLVSCLSLGFVCCVICTSLSYLYSLLLSHKTSFKKHNSVCIRSLFGSHSMQRVADYLIYPISNHCK